MEVDTCNTTFMETCSSYPPSTSLRFALSEGAHTASFGIYAQQTLFPSSSFLLQLILLLKPILFFVHSAAVNSDTHEEVAIKKVGNAFHNIIDAKRTLREIKLLRHMDHENVPSLLFFQTNLFLFLFLFLLLCLLISLLSQIIAVRDIIRPPRKDAFNDVYIVYELMDTDLHHVIRSDQPLNDDHCQVSLCSHHCLFTFALIFSIQKTIIRIHIHCIAKILSIVLMFREICAVLFVPAVTGVEICAFC